MARTKINDKQLDKLVSADKVDGGAINITGSANTLSTLEAADHFLVQEPSGVPKKVTADTMSAYFSKVDLTEADSENAEMRIVFVDASGTDNEDLFVDTGVLTYNPTGDILTVPHLKSPILRSAAGLDIDAGGSGKLTLDGPGGIDIGVAANVAVDFNSAAFDLDAAGAITIDGTSTLSIDAVDDSNLTVTAAAKDLDIAVAGGGTQELRLASAGTGASALHLNASAGGVDIDSADMITLDAADEITLTTTSADGHISLVTAHTSGVAFHIDANADAASEVQIDAGILDVDVTGAATIDAGGAMTLTAAGVALAGGSSEVDITTSGAFDVNVGSVDLDSSAGVAIDGTVLSLDGTDDSNLTVTASGKDLDIAVAGGSTQELRLASAGTGASALHLNASAGGVDIDSADMITLDAADEIALTTTSADGHISLVSAHTSGVAFHIDANANAASEVQIDAGILDVDVTGAATIDAGGAMTLTAAGVALAGGSSEIDITTSGALDLNGGAVTVDGTSISLDASDSSNFSMAGNSSSDVTLTIAASNSGSGAGNMALSADTVTITGNLDVNGTTTTIDTVNVAISDHNIILDRENSTSNVVDGAGITMEGGSGDDITLQQLAASGGLELKKGSAYHGLVAGKFMVDGTGNHMDVTGDVLTLTAGTSFEIASAADIVLDGADVVIDGTSSKLEFGAAASGEHITGDGTDLTIASGAKLNLSATSDVILPDNVGMLFGDVSAGGEKIEGNGTKLVISSSEDIDLTATTNINIPANVGLKFGDDADGISANSGGTITMAAGALVLDSEGDITLDADGADVILSDGGTESARFTMAGTTSVELAAQGDIILDPAGNNVLPGSDSTDSLGKGATSASHSEGSQTLSTSGLTSSQSISMSASGNHAVLFGSSLSAPSASSADSGFTSALQAVSQNLSAFSSTFNGTLSMGSYSGSTISAGSIFSLNGSSSSFYFVVTSDYSSGSSISVCAMPNVNGHSTSIGSISSVSSYSSSGFSGSGALSGVSVSAGETVSFTLSGGSAVFVSVVGPSSSTPWGFIGDPRNDVSSASTFSGTPSAAKAGGSITAASDAVAWAHLYSDAITMGGTLITATSTELNHLDGIADAAYDASADSVVFFDATDSKLKYESANDFASTVGGDGIQVASGVFSIVPVIELATKASKGAILSDDFKTASLAQVPLSGSLQVFLNGMLQTPSGSTASGPQDYTGVLSGTTAHSQALWDYVHQEQTGSHYVYFQEAIDEDDVVQLRYIKN